MYICSSDTLPGSIVLIIFYGYLLLRGAQLLSNGSELLLEVISPGLIGGDLQSCCLASPPVLIVFRTFQNIHTMMANEQLIARQEWFAIRSSCDIDKIRMLPPSSHLTGRVAALSVTALGHWQEDNSVLSSSWVYIHDGFASCRSPSTNSGGTARCTYHCCLGARRHKRASS